MALQQIELLEKVALTRDVYKLTYSFPEHTPFIAGQFVTFILPGIGGRAYSILEKNEKSISLIIKRRSKESGGRGGSIALCDAEVGDSFKSVGPAGHFVLQESNTPKCFIGTGTGLVPLYNQIVFGLAKATGEKYQLVFGVRQKEDLFYMQEFSALKETYPDTFYYHIVVSRDETDGIIHKGYVTDFLSSKVVRDFGEYYICGAPGMIDSTVEKLKSLGVEEKSIYFERYT